MPSYSVQPGDVQWIIGLLSSLTVYPSRAAATTAASTLSAANSNAPVQIVGISRVITESTATVLAQENMGGAAAVAGVRTFIVQLAPGTTYYPLESARLAAHALSAANGGAAVVVGRVHLLVTAP